MTPYLQTLDYIFVIALPRILVAAAIFYLAVGLYRVARPIRGGFDAVRDNMLVSIAFGVLALGLRSL